MEASIPENYTKKTENSQGKSFGRNVFFEECGWVVVSENDGYWGWDRDAEVVSVAHYG